MRDFIERAFTRMQIEILKDLVENPSDPFTSWRRYLPTRLIDWEYRMFYSAVDKIETLGLIHKYGIARNITVSFKGLYVYNKMQEMEFNNATFIRLTSGG